MDLQPQHSLLGASGAYRWLNCPGSFKLSQTAPHRRSSVYAAQGTVAHWYIEQAKHTGFMPLAPATVGETWNYDGYTGTVDQDFVDGVNVMTRYLYEAVPRVDFIAVEQRVCLDAWFENQKLPVSLFGTADALLFEPKLLEIVDYKNGAGVKVTPVWNPQHLFYAAGAVFYAAAAVQLRSIPMPDRLRLTVVQPHAGGEPIRSWDLSLVDLMMWIDEVLKPGVEACLAPDPPLVPGTWCRFCPVAHACPELHKSAIAAAKTEFENFESHPIDLADMLATAEQAEIWIARLRDFALEQLQHQVRIPGWELVPTRPTRKWTRPDDDMAQVLINLGIDAKDAWELRLRSPAQLEKILTRTRAGSQFWRTQVEPKRLFDARSSGVKIGRSQGTSAAEDFADEE